VRGGAVGAHAVLYHRKPHEDALRSWANKLIQTVRRQSFWDTERFKLRESLARLVNDVMPLADGAASGDWQLSGV
jgi:hypothetical protein